MAEPANSPVAVYMGSLSRAGFPNSDLFLVDDLGKHAAGLARDSIDRVVATAPLGLRVAVQMNAMLRLHEAAAAMSKRLGDAGRKLKEERNG